MPKNVLTSKNAIINQQAKKKLKMGEEAMWKNNWADWGTAHTAMSKTNHNSKIQALTVAVLLL